MKFSIEREVALPIFQKAAKVKPPGASTLSPNLDKALVVADDTGIAVYATNLLQIVKIEQATSVAETGKAVLPKPAEMVQFLQALPDGVVTFDAKDTTLVVSAGSASMVRQIVPVNTYPSIPDFDVVQTWHSVPTGLFNQDLKAVAVVAGASTDQNLAQVVVKDNVFYGATNASAHVQEASGYECPDLALSVSALPLVRSLVLSSENEYVEIGFAKNAILLRVSGLVLLAYTPTAPYPDVVAPLVQAALSNSHLVEVDRDEFSRAVSQVWGTTDTFGAVFVSVSSDGKAVLRSKSVIGSTETALTCSYQGPDKEFILSAWSLSSALGCYPQQVCKVYLGDAANSSGVKDIPPVRLSATSGEGGDFVAVLSQLRKDLL